MNTAPTTYAIRVDGHLDDHWSAWLGWPRVGNLAQVAASAMAIR
jgi:hypothetical protein